MNYAELGKGSGAGKISNRPPHLSRPKPYAEITYDNNSSLQQAISAATAAIQCLAGGNIGQALSGAAAPYLATVIKNTVGEDNLAANAMAHAVVGAVVAPSQWQLSPGRCHGCCQWRIGCKINC